MRLRADHDVNGLRVAMLKAVLIRNLHGGSRVARFRKQGLRLSARSPVRRLRIDPDAALGPNVNATIKRQILRRGRGDSHARSFLCFTKGRRLTSRELRKDKPGLAVVLESRIGEIIELRRAGFASFPTHIPQRQALFAVGYYHQRNEFYRSKEEPRADAKRRRSHAHDRA